MSATKALVPAKSVKEVLESFASVFDDYRIQLDGITRISNFVSGKDELVSYFTTAGGISAYQCRELFALAPAKARLDATFWAKVMGRTDLLECMSAEKRNEWNAMIHENKAPAFELEDVVESVRSLLLSREKFLAEKVDGIFQSLSGHHVTNSPMGFRKRMIVSYVVEASGTGQKWYSISFRKAEYLHDLRAVIGKLLGRDEPKWYDTQRDLRFIVNAGAFGKWHDFDGGAFRVRLYKAGTAHLEVHPEVATKLNRILASLHPQVLYSNIRQERQTATKAPPLKRDLLPFAVVAELLEAAANVQRERVVDLHGRELDQATQARVEEVLRFVGGETNGGCWRFPFDTSPVLIQIARLGYLPERKSHQFYPTPQDLAERVVSLLDLDPEDQVLEPSAGHGALAEWCPPARTTCVEIDAVNAEILGQKGFRVVLHDFLAWKTARRFSKIVMNPPFGDGAALNHLRKAASLLEPGGKLVAILPASLRYHKLVPGFAHEWSEVIENAFEDTNVRVVILELTKEEPDEE